MSQNPGATIHRDASSSSAPAGADPATRPSTIARSPISSRLDAGSMILPPRRTKASCDSLRRTGRGIVLVSASVPLLLPAVLILPLIVGIHLVGDEIVLTALHVSAPVAHKLAMGGAEQTAFAERTKLRPVAGPCLGMFIVVLGQDHAPQRWRLGRKPSFGRRLTGGGVYASFTPTARAVCPTLPG